MKKRLKYVNSVRAGGRLFWYFRRNGEYTRLPDEYGSPEFLTRYHELIHGSGGSGVPARDVVGALIASYIHSQYWAEKLGDESRRTQLYVLKRFGGAYGQNRVKMLSRQHIVAIMHKQATLYAQRNWLIAIKPLLNHAVALGWIETNPCDGIKIEMPGGDGFTAWTDHEIGVYRQHHELGTLPRLALELLLNTMARSGDAIVLGPGNIWNGRLCWKPQKSERHRNAPPVAIRVLPELQAAIDAMAPSGAGQPFLIARNGRPFTKNGWHRTFARWVAEAGIADEFRAHGLRKAGMIRLAYAGATEAELAACSGHKALAMVRRYIEAAQRSQLADNAMARLEDGANISGTKIAKKQRAVSQLSEKDQ
jgi:Phage integrase family